MKFLSKKDKIPNRNRNLTNPKQSVSVFQYHNSVDDQDNPKVVRKNDNKLIKIKKRLVFLLIIVITVGVIDLLYLSPNPSVVYLSSSSINTNIYNQLYTNQIVNKTDQLMNSSMFNGNKITVDINNIQNTLQSDFPQFSDVNFSLPLFGHRPTIYLTIATPALIFSVNQNQYLMNQNGVIAMQMPKSNLLNGINLPLVSGQNQTNIKIGEPLFTTQEVSFIQNISTQLSIKKYPISNMVLSSSGVELDVYLKGKSYYIKFNLENNDPQIQAGSFLAVQNYLNSKNITPSQYIDVRVDSKAYYK